MTPSAKTVAALAGAAGSATVLATVHAGWVDVPDAAILIVSLGVLTRRAIRLAGEPDRVRDRQR